MAEMPDRYLQNVPQNSKFAVWAWSPVIVLRLSLFANYAVLVYCAVIAFVAGVPVFNLTTPAGFTSVWALLLGFSSLLSAIGATADRWQPLERWSSLVLTAMLMAYVGGLNGVGWVEGDLGRQFIGGIAIAVSILPTTRFVYLAAQSGKKRAKHVPSNVGT